MLNGWREGVMLNGFSHEASRVQYHFSLRLDCSPVLHRTSPKGKTAFSPGRQPWVTGLLIFPASARKRTRRSASRATVFPRRAMIVSRTR